MESNGGHHTCFINSLLVAFSTLVPLVRFLLCCFGFSFDHFSHGGSHHNRSENQWEYSVYPSKPCTWTLEKHPHGKSVDLLNPLRLRSGWYVPRGSISHHTRQRIILIFQVPNYQCQARLYISQLLRGLAISLFPGYGYCDWRFFQKENWEHIQLYLSVMASQSPPLRAPLKSTKCLASFWKLRETSPLLLE